jgi:hypothetical protein
MAKSKRTKEEIAEEAAAQEVARRQEESDALGEQIAAQKREAFVSRFVDRADGERQWENLLARRGIGR